VIQLVANNAGTVITLTATDNADCSYTLTFPAGTSYVAGRYLYSVYSELAGVKTQIFGGAFNMLASLASGDSRSPAQIILDALDAVIAGRATANQRSVTVGDKTISYMSMSELIQAREYYKEIVDDESAEIEGRNNQTYYAEFRRA